MLSAVGGQGEPGHMGGNGQSGMNGVDGAPATREVDATVRARKRYHITRANLPKFGTNGGNGGE